VRVSVCFTVEVPTTTFSGIEEACVAAGRTAAREAMVQAMHRLEAARGPRARRAVTDAGAPCSPGSATSRSPVVEPAAPTAPGTSRWPIGWGTVALAEARAGGSDSSLACVRSARARARKPSAPLARGSQAGTWSIWSWLHPLKGWSLQETRNGSVRSPAASLIRPFVSSDFAPMAEPFLQRFTRIRLVGSTATLAREIGTQAQLLREALGRGETATEKWDRMMYEFLSGIDQRGGVVPMAEVVQIGKAIGYDGHGVSGFYQKLLKMGADRTARLTDAGRARLKSLQPREEG
jgi:hypothetical protein